jgi:protein O-GlcNAc transferase
MAFVGKWFGFGRNADYDEGLRAFEAGDYAAAAERFRAAMGAGGDLSLRQRAKSYLAGSLGKIGRAAMERGDHTAAVQALGDAVAVRPRYADLHVALALAHDALGEHHRLHEEVRAALRINPKYGHAVLLEAALLMRSGAHGDGLFRAVEAVSLDRRLETDTYRKAIEAADAEKWNEAADLIFAVRPVGGDAADHQARGDRMMQAGRWEDAEEAYRQALEAAPHYADLRSRHGQALFELGHVDQAVDAFREAVTINPKFAEAHALLGVSLRRLGQEDEAKEAFRAALEADPDNVIARQELSRQRFA